MTGYYFTGTARSEGQNVMHTIHRNTEHHDGTHSREVVGTRRSAHFYRYAFVKGYRYDGETRHAVTRYSKNPERRSGEFAVPISLTR
jgi:hypothetical protein